MKGLASLLAVAVAAAFGTSAFAAEPTDKAKEWCTDEHMKVMDDQLSKMTDAAKKKDCNQASR